TLMTPSTTYRTLAFSLGPRLPREQRTSPWRRPRAFSARSQSTFETAGLNASMPRMGNLATSSACLRCRVAGEAFDDQTARLADASHLREVDRHCLKPKQKADWPTMAAGVLEYGRPKLVRYAAIGVAASLSYVGFDMVAEDKIRDGTLTGFWA